jgi:AraC-like DNA-binding protein
MKQRKAEQKDLYPVMASEYIKRYLTYLAHSQEKEFACIYYLKLKQMELFHYLSSDYSEKELAKLLAPVLSINIIFAIKVIENYRLFGTIDNLVETMNYSQADFKKQFTRIFGKSPYRWMYNKKAEQVYHSLIGNRKTFTQLAIDLGFSSPSHFNNFCQQAFNASPGEVRKGKRVRI